MPPAIYAQGITKAYQRGWFKPRHTALDDVSLEAPAGAIFGILGPNAAGKTTFISILSTLLRPDAGQARVLGLDVVRDAARLRQRINLAASGAHFLWCLTVEDNLKFYGRLYGLWGKALQAQVDRLLELFDLGEHRRATFERLSTGLKQRLSLAKALINTPELLFLDEPTSGLDQDMARHTRQEILRLNRETGLTILLTTHNLREAGELCSEVGFLKQGRLLARGSLRELQQRLGLGDQVRLVFADGLPAVDFARLPGVLTHRAAGREVTLVLDKAENRLAPIMATLIQSGAAPAQVRVKEVDLEEIYHEITH